MSCVMVFFIILATSTTIVCSTSAPSDMFLKIWHVHVVNGMSSNKILFVHCKSRENDIGKHNLTVGSEIQWKFKPRLWGRTLFWCYMASDNRHASLKVFWDDGNFYYRCNWKTCIWTAKDDGIYLKNILGNYDELRHRWVPNSIV